MSQIGSFYPCASAVGYAFFNGQLDEVALYTHVLPSLSASIHHGKGIGSSSGVTTTYYLLGGQVETDSLGGTTRLDVSGPAGDLAHYSLDAAQWRLAFSWDKKSDPASSLVEMGARPYDPASGRFLAVDPIVGGSLNTYDYAGQDPINRYDLDGTLTAPCPGRARSYDCAQGSPGLGPKAVAGKAKKI